MLARHDDVTAAVGLARHDGDFWHRRFGISVEQLRAVANDAVILLLRARQKSRHIDKRHDGNIEAVAKSNKARRLHRGVDVQTARQMGRLVGDNAHRAAAEMGKADENIARELRLHFVEIAFIDHRRDQLFHVIGPVGIIGNQIFEPLVAPQRIVVGRMKRRIFLIVAR